MRDNAGRFCSYRLFEWTMSVALVVTGLIIFIWPMSVTNSAFHMILRLVGPYQLAMIYFGVGAIRIAGLIINDRWCNYGSNIRAATALASSMIWLQIIAAFVLILPERDGVPSPSLGLYSCLVLAEWYSTYRAVARG
jgi:hypothetical protein